MTGTSYRLAIKPMVPGDKADPANFKIMESMPVRAIITSPANGSTVSSLSTIAGSASDNAGGSGIHRVRVFLRRYQTSGGHPYWIFSSSGDFKKVP